MGFVGCGQGGGNVVGAFHSLGYRRTAAINSSGQDMHGLPSGVRKLNLSGESLGGAGKDPAVAAKMVAGRADDMFDLLAGSWGTGVDYGLVCVGLGGGTGTGTAAAAVKAARDYLRSTGQDNPKVGAIVSLPSGFEGGRVATNAVNGFRELLGLGLSPLIVIDNQRIRDIYNPTATQLWKQCDQAVTRTFHLLNQLAAQRGQLATFDKQDMASILDSGLLTFGASTIQDLTSQDAIAKAVRHHLDRSALVKVDYRKGTHAGLVLVGGQQTLSKMPSQLLDYAFEALSRNLAKGAVLHRGIYLGAREEVRAFTIVGGLEPPIERLTELAVAGGMDSTIASKSRMGAYLGLA